MRKNTIFLKSKAKYRADFVDLLVSMSIASAVLSFSLYLSPAVSERIRGALSMCYFSIIPSVFPFMIISDIMLSYMHFERVGFIRSAFSKIFKINGYAISAFICGALCGFPIGVKIARDFYECGIISRDECERLIGFSNHASPAFVISAVGFGMRGSIADGVVLYVVSILSSVIISMLLTPKKQPQEFYSPHDIKSDFSLTASVSHAASTTINVCGFICFFSALLGILSIFIDNDTIFAVIASFFEIGNSSKLISENELFSEQFSLALTGFAVTFSGFSVHLQAKSQLFGTDISMKKYYITKFLSAILSFVLCLVISFFVK